MITSSENRHWLIRDGGRPWICALALFAVLAVGGSVAGDGTAQSGGVAYSVELKGILDTSRYREFERTLDEAKKNRARLVILRLDTPGGTVNDTRAMVDDMLAAPMPVVVHVAPDGARAGSGGVFLTVAADVAAMAPQTNIGSASPIAGGPDGARDVPRVLYRKVVNDLAAYVRTLAEGHGRNADLAERMVRRATNVTARRARRERLVDLVAGSEAALLERLDGFRVKGRKARVLRTAGLRLVPFDPSATPDEDQESDGALLLGLSLPGLIAVGIFAMVLVFLLAQLLGLGSRRRSS